MFGSWLYGPGKNSASSASRHGGDRHFHPRLEQLEDRSVPSAMTVVNNLPPATLAGVILQNLPSSPPTSATLAINGAFKATANQAGAFANAGTIIGLNYGVVLGGWNVGILQGPYLDVNPNPDVNTVLSFKFIPHGSVGQIRIVMASDEYGFPGPFPDQVGVFVNGVQKAYIGGKIISPTNFPLGDPHVISNQAVVPPFFPPFGTGAGTPFEIDAGGFTIPITLQFALKPNKVNTLTFAESTGVDLLYPTWLFVEPLQVLKGPNIQTFNAYPAPIYEAGLNEYLEIITIENLGGTALTATHALYVTIPGLPSGAVITSAGGGYLPGTSIPAVKLPTKTISPGQKFSVQVLFTNPYNLALPTFFTSKPVVYAE